MKLPVCLPALLLILAWPLCATCQERGGGQRGGDVRALVSDERGNRPAAETQIYTNSYALLIGNAKYQDRGWNDLPDVDNDIAAVREVLEKEHGFKVEVALNQSRGALLGVIDRFIGSYGHRSGNRLLIYYSGHGYTALLPDERKMGYLVLPDAPAMPGAAQALRTPPSEEEFERFLPAAITMDEIEAFARRITAKHVLFVFDSCFSGTVLYKDLGTGVPALLTAEELKPVRAYLTAGNETQPVPAFSRFRRKFVVGLSGDADTNGDGYILSSELGRWISVEVQKDTGRQQTPVFGKSDLFKRGDVIFVSPKGAPPREARKENRPPAAASPPSRFAASMAWGYEPLIAGGWEAPDESASQSIYDNLLKSVPARWAGPAKRITQFRRTKLSFYPDAYLYEGLVPADNFNKGGVFSFIVSAGGKITLLDGSSPPIHRLNAEFPLKLDSDEQAEDYLRFFHAAVYGSEGDFHIVDNGSDLLWEKDVSVSNRQIVEKHIKPLLIERIKEGVWHFEVTIQYSDAVFYAKMELRAGGMVEMIEDQPFSADLPLRRQAFDGPLRHEVPNWGLSSLVSGYWEVTDEATSQKIFGLLSNAYSSTELIGTVRQVKKLRRVKLPFYAGAYLYEGLIPATSYREPGIFTFIVLQDGTLVLLNGLPQPIHDLNKKVPLSIATKEQAEAYFRFFNFAVYGEGGNFRVIDWNNKIAWLDTITEDRKKKIELHIKPVSVTKAANGDWLANATVQYRNGLSHAKYRLDKGGVVEMLEESVIESNLPVRSDRFKGAVRYEFERNKNLKTSITVVDAQFHNSIGMRYLDQGNLDVATSYFTKAIQLNPIYAEAYLNRSSAQLEKGVGFEQALKDCSKAIELKENYADAYLSRGIIHDRLQMYDKAIADFQTVLRLEPGNRQAKGNLENVKGKKRT